MELKKYTLALAKKRESAAKADVGEASWRAKYEFLRDAVPDGLDEALDGSKLTDIDLAKLDALFINVCLEYDRPATEAADAAIREQLGGIDMDTLNVLTDGFKNVR